MIRSNIEVHKKHYVQVRSGKQVVAKWSYYFTEEWLVVLDAQGYYIYKESRNRETTDEKNHTRGHELVCMLYQESKIINKELKKRGQFNEQRVGSRFDKPTD